MKLTDVVGPAAFLTHTGGCASCPRRKVDFVPATLNSAPVIVVGEAPGATEVEEQEGFVGRSGQLLREMLEGAGISDYSLTNTIHCRPPDNKTPTAKEVSCCMKQLTMDEVRGYPFVLLTGATAAKAFFPGWPGNKLRGNLAHHPDYPGQRFLYTYHPAYILRSPSHRPQMEKHLSRLAQAMARGGEPSFTLYTPQHEDFWDRFEEVLAAKVISFDLETTRLESWMPDARITSAALACTETWAVAFHEDDPCFIGALERISTTFTERRKQVVGFNLGFDLDFLERETGIPVQAEVQHDVQVLYYEAKQYQRMSLKELVSLEGDGYEHMCPWPDRPEWDADLLMQYNAEDVIHPLKLFKKGVKMLKPETLDLYIRAGGPSSLACRRMQTEGVWFHAKKWREAQEQLDRELEEAKAAWAEADPKFDPEKHISGNGLQEYLFEIRGAPVLKKTDTGRPSTDESVLKQLIREYKMEELEHLLNIRGIEKKRGTYVNNVPDLVSTDGCIHPNYWNTSTDTWRLSSSEPNFQNQPRGPLIRGFYGAPPGRVFGQGDFSQIELRIAVSLANDYTAIQRYNEGLDLHMQTARIISGSANPTYEERTKAKSINFALVYGGSWEGLQEYAANNYGIYLTDAEAKKFVKLFFTEVVPNLENWHRKVEQELVQNRGWAMNATGHVFYYEGWNSDNHGHRAHVHRSHLNSKCQGPASSITIYSLVLAQREVIRRKLATKIVGSVHDSILFHTSEDEFADTVMMFQSCVRDVENWVSPWFKVPLVMDFERAEDGTWGTLKEYEEAA